MLSWVAQLVDCLGLKFITQQVSGSSLMLTQPLAFLFFCLCRHWVALYNRLPDKVIYFDSYGEPPPEQVMTWIRKTGKKHLIMSRQQIQALDSPWCGYYCLTFIHSMQHGQGLTKFIRQFSDNPTINDRKMAIEAKKIFHMLQ